MLDDIDGIGAKRKTKLLRTFGSIKKMKEASLEDLKNLDFRKMLQKLTTRTSKQIKFQFLDMRIILMSKNALNNVTI